MAAVLALRTTYRKLPLQDVVSVLANPNLITDH